MNSLSVLGAPRGSTDHTLRSGALHIHIQCNHWTVWLLVSIHFSPPRLGIPSLKMLLSLTFAFLNVVLSSPRHGALIGRPSDQIWSHPLWVLTLFWTCDIIHIAWALIVLSLFYSECSKGRVLCAIYLWKLLSA